ncbi:hypothetical protein V3481_004939 [Fusarium oxysporum f. sp. vasinfectum]
MLLTKPMPSQVVVFNTISSSGLWVERPKASLEALWLLFKHAIYRLSIAQLHQAHSGNSSDYSKVAERITAPDVISCKIGGLASADSPIFRY